eukprot:TRINITY_DN5871_c0_g1_i3.p1 TRINITY_DN5871_c0_g1~~TRINITY_DN5871_c0_g1_i3.p1  ORF type:complete len:297 (+),score=25.99 TRINITY_DN5871_c0_g1_i3:400-1290(+)
MSNVGVNELKKYYISNVIVSTSRSKQVAEIDFEAHVLFIIRINQYIKGADISDMSRFPWEEEFILLPFQRLVVERFEDGPNGVKYVYCTGENPAPQRRIGVIFGDDTKEYQKKELEPNCVAHCINTSFLLQLIIVFFGLYILIFAMLLGSLYWMLGIIFFVFVGYFFIPICLLFSRREFFRKRLIEYRTLTIEAFLTPEQRVTAEWELVPSVLVLWLTIFYTLVYATMLGTRYSGLHYTDMLKQSHSINPFGNERWVKLRPLILCWLCVQVVVFVVGLTVLVWYYAPIQANSTSFG